MTIPLHVVKLGGSLLGLADLAPRLNDWLGSQDDAATVLLVGGGHLADRVREADRTTALGDEVAHWRAVDAMSRAAAACCRRLPEVPLVHDLAGLAPRIARPGVTLFDAGRFLRDEETDRPGTRLARDWSVTSDSIAARLAIVLEADELVLLKSALPERADDLEQLAAAGYVDRFFPKLAAELPPLRAVNLRDRRLSECRWTRAS